MSLDLPLHVGLGGTVPIALIIENTADRPLDLYLRGRDIAFDLVVTDPDGHTVWRRLDGEIIPAILRLETLAPAHVLRLEHTWDQRSNDGSPVPPGEYRIHGELLTEDEPLVTPSISMRIAPH